MKSADREIALLAATQFGVISWSQALRVGLSPSAIQRRLRSGQWIRRHKGVYVLNGVAASWQQSLMAAQLALGEAALISHRSAGTVLGLEGMSFKILELTLPRPKRPLSANMILHRTNQMLPRDRRKYGPLIVTSVDRTLIDVGAVVDAEVVEQALDHALRARMTNLSRLKQRLELMEGPGRAGPSALRKLLNERDPQLRPPDSILEARTFKILRRTGLPAPVRQYEIREGDRFVARVDLAYPDLKVAIECDGQAYHSGFADVRRDAKRANRIAQAGWRMLRVTWDDLKRPDDLATGVLVALEVENRL